MSSPSPFDPPLDKPRHLRYWQRCARTLLPHHYTPNDSQRLTLGFFIIAAIDLLSPSSSSSENTKPLLTPSDRRSLRAWVLSCQHPHGGFCGSPSHVLPRAAHETDGAGGGNANIAATYFALLLLPMLTEPGHAEGGAYAGVDRARTLRWLRRLQRVDGDGSFGEVVYELPSFGNNSDGTKDTERRRDYIVGGGKDMRYCYLAAVTRWILRGDVKEGDEAYVEDIDVPALVRHIHRSQSYDGGFSESLGHESHAGYAYCAVAALALLDRPVNNNTSTSEAGGEQQQQAPSPHYTQSKILQEGIGDIPGFISFLVSRQFAYLEAEKKEAEEEGEEEEEDPETANFHMADLSLSEQQDDTKHVGFNGRCNKVADTCYTWWVLGSLSILGVLDKHTPPSPSSPSSSSASSPATVDPEALRAARTFLLEKTQHAIGGFGKRAADPPDIYHSSLGLFALATMGDPELKRVDAGLAVSVDTVGKIEAGRRGLLRRARNGKAASGAAFGGKALVDMAVSMGDGGERPAWLDVVV
ncbi:terpenoid cyclases/protein prenyltransferase alpha-alpha toroid [Diaporthe sp. PMI_573]|nr:terpenoid cyclases/protein prenyltransferase alpha-alpha toroid [Diaporthaceae sp. PMI_573]